MIYFVEVTLSGMFAGALYSLLALGFVVIYKGSRIMNFALGEFVMVGGSLVALALNVLHLGLLPALLMACAGMAALIATFNHLVLRHVARHSLIAMIMVTIGLGAFLRASAALVFRGYAGAVSLPIPREPFQLSGVLVSPIEIVAGCIAILGVVAVSLFFRKTRVGLALRAVADDQTAAMAMGINLGRYFAITWILAGIIAVAGGTLWSFNFGGGFSMVLVGLKVFPIVILGGLDSIPGVVVGGIFIGLLESLAAAFIDPLVEGAISNVAPYAVLLTVLMIRPQGLFGGREVAERP